MLEIIILTVLVVVLILLPPKWGPAILLKEWSEGLRSDDAASTPSGDDVRGAVQPVGSDGYTETHGGTNTPLHGSYGPSGHEHIPFFCNDCGCLYGKKGEEPRPHDPKTCKQMQKWRRWR